MTINEQYAALAAIIAANDQNEDRCTACHRDSETCSRNPCPDVIEDRKG